MLSVTLDTSCALNFLALDEEEPDPDLLRLLHLAVRHGVLVGVTSEAYEEVALHGDESRARRQTERLGVFGRLALPVGTEDDLDDIATKLHGALFPNARAGSRTDEHNWRDCRQLAAHRFVGRALFVTRDNKLLQRAEGLEGFGISVVDPARALRAATEALPERVGAGVAVRAADSDQDEAGIRRILGPLADAYPNFDQWLTGALSTSRISVAELDGQLGAVALSRPKDSRVHKLAAFMVAPEFRRAGLGGHLLWSELRSWAQDEIQKVYVTVSTRLPELLPFFADFGFVIEGVSARRYSDDHSEFVLAKHFAYGRFGADSLDTFAAEIAAPVLIAPRIEAPMALAVAENGHLAWSRDGANRVLQHVGSAGNVLRSWSLLDVERMFFPATLAIPDRPVLLVPIEEQWAAALIEFPGGQLALTEEATSQRLMLRPDNAYYCYPTAYDAATPGTPILFYVKSPVSAVVGEARIVESAIDVPEELFIRFGDLGVYQPEAIREHVRRNGRYDGCAMALRFAQYQPFEQPVRRLDMLTALGRPLSGPQGLTPISFEDFEAVRRIGGL